MPTSSASREKEREITPKLINGERGNNENRVQILGSVSELAGLYDEVFMENQVLKAKIEMLERMVDRQPLASLAGPERRKVEKAKEVLPLQDIMREQERASKAERARR